MPEISLIRALKLILRFVDSEDIGAIIRSTVAELERLYQIEKLAAEMAELGKQNLVDDELIVAFEAVTTIRRGENAPGMTPERVILERLQKQENTQ